MTHDRKKSPRFVCIRAEPTGEVEVLCPLCGTSDVYTQDSDPAIDNYQHLLCNWTNRAVWNRAKGLDPLERLLKLDPPQEGAA